MTEKKPEKNMVCRLEITDLNNLGYGVGRYGGQVVFVAGAIDGDVVDAQIILVKSGYAVARVVELLAPSPHRREPLCAAKGCGGCAYLCTDATHEKELKENSVRAAFRKQGLSDIEILSLQETGVRTGYRNKAQYPVAQTKNGVAIGFYAPRSHRVVPAEDCPLQDPAFPPILKELHRLIDLYKIQAYDEKTRKGLLRHIYLRRGKVSGEILLTLVINGKKLPHSRDIVSSLRKNFPAIVGILLNINEEDTNVICGETYIPLWGKESLTDTLCGVELEIAPAAFYQVNHDATELLYARAREAAALKGDELLLDLFCGIGSIGLSMSDGVREVIGIEVVPEAVECAKKNAAKNGITNAAFYCGDATDTEKLLASAEKERGEKIRPDVVLLDPPRRGCEPELLSFLGRLAPARIVYVSCNPETLARDVALLMKEGYTPGAVTPVNLFPVTGHVESVICLTRR